MRMRTASVVLTKRVAPKLRTFLTIYSCYLGWAEAVADWSFNLLLPFPCKLHVRAHSLGTTLNSHW